MASMWIFIGWGSYLNKKGQQKSADCGNGGLEIINKDNYNKPHLLQTPQKHKQKS